MPAKKSTAVSGPRPKRRELRVRDAIGDDQIERGALRQRQAGADGARCTAASRLAGGWPGCPDWTEAASLEHASAIGHEDVVRVTGVDVAPDGTVYIVDGYGKSFVHVYDKNQKYLKNLKNQIMISLKEMIQQMMRS